MRRLKILIGVACLAASVSASADVRGPEGDRGFRYVYPVSASPAEAARLYHDDLKALAGEGAKLQASDGGTLTDDHRAYLETRRTVVERRYADARGQTVTTGR